MGEIHEINLAPLIDVMRVPLIVFMIAAPLATVDIPVNLPAMGPHRTSSAITPLHHTARKIFRSPWTPALLTALCLQGAAITLIGLSTSNDLDAPEGAIAINFEPLPLSSDDTPKTRRRRRRKWKPANLCARRKRPTARMSFPKSPRPRLHRRTGATEGLRKARRPRQLRRKQPAIALAAPAPPTAAPQEGALDRVARAAVSKWQPKVDAAIERRKI